MARQAAKILGLLFIAIGIIGFISPAFMGTHLSLTHNIIHLVSGVLSLYFSSSNKSLEAAKKFCIGFGIFYFLLGLAGMLLGKPDVPVLDNLVMGTDQRLLRVIPGVLELGMRDHILHLIFGSLYFMAGVFTHSASKRVMVEKT